VTFDYAFGGLAVSSAIPLEGLRPGTASGPAIRVTGEAGPPPAPDHVHFTWPGRYRMRLAELGDRWLVQSAFDGTFLFARDGSAMHIFSSQLPPGRDLLDVLARRLLPRVAILHGATLIHAAALADERGALLLLGTSGAGKSTLTAALAHIAGLRILSDDMSLVWRGEPATIAPAATGVCVWPASREGLGLPLAECHEMSGYEGKVRFDPPGGDTIASAQLRAFVFLNRSDAIAEPRLTRLSLAEGMAGAIPQILFFNPNGSSVDERIASLNLVNRAMRVAPAWRLDYPASFAALPDVTRIVSALLS
jgi:hypothetical protein